MDYYEELGIDRSASTGEIRQAYRRLMQLLHPDHCGDEACRRLAGLQARRLNSMLETLTDPAERERYNHELSIDRSVAASLPPQSGHGRDILPWLWIVGGLAAAVALFLVRPFPPRAAPAVEDSTAAREAPAPSLEKPIAPKVRSSKPVRPKRSAMYQQDESAAVPPQEVPEVVAPRMALENPPALQVPDWMPESFPAVVPPAVDQTVAPVRSAFAGEWLFLPHPKIHSDGLYPPEYIELRVAERGGSLCGKYRARYHVTDRAISPNVTFDFQGQGGDKDAHLPWTGPNGERGLVTLHLLTNSAMEVTWVVSRLGNEAGLISGTATLVRKIE